MPKLKLTDAAVQRLKAPPGGRVDYFDATLPGFALRVSGQTPSTPEGRRTWTLFYRFGGKQKRLSLSPTYPTLGLGEARRQAGDILGRLSEGHDPAAERVQAKAEAKAVAPERLTFGRLIEAWRLARDGERRPRYVAEVVRCLRQTLAPMLDMDAASITPGEAVLALDRIKNTAGGTTSNRVLSYARLCYSWAVRRRMLEINPFAGIERPARETARERTLTIIECGAIWRAAGNIGAPFGAIVRLLLLTLARRDEVAGLQWPEIAPDFTSWTLPASRAKNGRAHVVHLSEPAREVVQTTPRFARCPLVFTTNQRTQVSGFSKFKTALDRQLAAQGTPLDPWTLHDFRRSGVTWLAGAGFPPHVCDKLLNHVGGTISGVAAVYQRAEFLPERARALDAWAAAVIAAAEGKAEEVNVVALRA
jgi:integrase